MNNSRVPTIELSSLQSRNFRFDQARLWFHSKISKNKPADLYSVVNELDANRDGLQPACPLKRVQCVPKASLDLKCFSFWPKRCGTLSEALKGS